MPHEVVIGNHQDAIGIPEAWLAALEEISPEIAAMAMARAATADNLLKDLAEVDIALVDDETSGQVHDDFMGIPGATDVITFHHGEIVIGVEVAERQAAEFGEPFPRELLRYIVHGMLHLAGHEDAEPDERATMEAAQEAIVATFWTPALEARLVR